MYKKFCTLRKMLLMSILGLFALAWSGAYAQDEVKIFTITDFNESGHSNPLCQTARFFSVSPEGKLVWVEEGPFMNSMWYRIPVEDSETDFYLKNVATGQYVYRGYLTDGVEQGDEGFSRNPTTASWNWDFAYLSYEIAEGNEEYFQFRALPARWGWATNLTNVAGAIWENHGADSNPAFGFVINGQHKQTPSINGDITNVGGALEYPAAGIMRCTDNGDQGNAWTCVHFDEVSNDAEFIKRKVNIVHSSNPGPQANFGINDDGDLEWMASANDRTAWYQILVDIDDEEAGFYLKNVATDEYLYRKDAGSVGGWNKSEALLSATNEETDFYKFNFLGAWNQSGWEPAGEYGFLYSLAGFLPEKINAEPVTSTEFGFVICAINKQWGWTGAPDADEPAYPVARVMLTVGGEGNSGTSVILVNAVEQTYYTVTFKKGNGTADDSKKVVDGGTVSPITDPTRMNYAFKGWFEDEDCAAWDEECEPFDFETLIENDLTLFAGWEYSPAPIEERSPRAVRIQNWGNEEFNSVFRPWAYLAIEDGEIIWSELADDDASIWNEIPVEGSNVLNYYQNVATGEYLYRGAKALPSGAWSPAEILLSEELEEENAFYQFWPIPKYNNGGNREWGQRVHLANMGDVTAENPYLVTGGAYYIGPNNANGIGGGPEYPKALMVSLDGNNGNVWWSVLIEPVITKVRIEDSQSNLLRYNEEEDALEWSEIQDDYSLWHEMLVDGSTTDYIYRNAGTTSVNHGTGKYIIRDEATYDGDWGPGVDALVAEDYNSEDLDDADKDYYRFRKVSSQWENRYWMLNLADAEFGSADPMDYTPNKSYVLSGINGAWTDWGSYPAVKVHHLGHKNEQISTVKFLGVNEVRVYTVTFNPMNGGSNINIRVEEGGQVSCPDENPTSLADDFVAWYEDEDCTIEYDCSSNTIVTGNMTFYAKWKPKVIDDTCVEEIEVIYISHFTNGGGDPPRKYLRSNNDGTVVSWELDDEIETSDRLNYPENINLDDKNYQWYKIPVRSSLIDFYLRNVGTGAYLVIKENSGAHYPDTYGYDEDGEPKEDEDPTLAGAWKEIGMQKAGGWVWKEITLDKSFKKDAQNYKWRYTNEGVKWGPNSVNIASLYKADWSANKDGGYYVISRININHGGDGYPDKDEGPPIASCIGGTTAGQTNVWSCTFIWYNQDENGVHNLFENPDCVDCNATPDHPECALDCDRTPDHPDCADVSAPEFGFLEDLNVYPNPAKDLITVDGLEGGEYITIIDLSGKVLSITKNSGTQVEVSVSNLPTGVYLVRVSKGNSLKTVRIIVNK